MLAPSAQLTVGRAGQHGATVGVVREPDHRWPRLLRAAGDRTRHAAVPQAHHDQGRRRPVARLHRRPVPVAGDRDQQRWGARHTASTSPTPCRPAGTTSTAPPGSSSPAAAPQSIEPARRRPGPRSGATSGRSATGESVVVTFAAVPGPGVVDRPRRRRLRRRTSTPPAAPASTPPTRPATPPGPYSGPAATASTRIDSADLVLDKTHVDPVVAGADATWRVAVTNTGADVAVGPFRVTDTLPAGRLARVRDRHGLVVRGIRCHLDCTRLTPGETLAVGGQPAGASRSSSTSPTTPRRARTLTNSATVTGRTYDPSPAEQHRHRHRHGHGLGRPADRQEPRPRPHRGWERHLDPRRRQRRPVGGGRPARSSPTPLPAGPHLRVGHRRGLVVRRRRPARDLHAGGRRCRSAPAPQITLVADVASLGDRHDRQHRRGHRARPPTPTPRNNTDTDRTPVVTNADLSIEKTHVGDFVAGDTGTYEFVVNNAGPSDAAVAGAHHRHPARRPDLHGLHRRRGLLDLLGGRPGRHLRPDRRPGRGGPGGRADHRRHRPRPRPRARAADEHGPGDLADDRPEPREQRRLRHHERRRRGRPGHRQDPHRHRGRRARTSTGPSRSPTTAPRAPPARSSSPMPSRPARRTSRRTGSGVGL